MRSVREIFIRFLPFWLYIVFFKFAGNIHYTALPALGEALFPVWLVGLIVSLESVLQVALDVPAGYLLDRFGYVRLLMLGSVCFAAASLFLIVGLTPATFVATVLSSVLGWLFFTPGVNAYLLGHAREDEAGRLFSMRDTSNALGVVLGVGGLSFILLLPVSTIGTAVLILLLVSLGFLYFAPPDKPLVTAPKAHPYHVRRQTARSLLATLRRLNPASSLLLAYNLAGSFFYAVIWFVVPLVIVAQHSQSAALGVGLAIFDTSIMLLGYIMGSLADTRDRRVLVFVGLFMFGLFGMLAGLTFGWLFVLFGFLASAGDEMAGVSLWAWLHALDREHAGDGAIAGMLTLAEDIGWSMGPILAGVLYVWAGPAFAIVLGAVPIFLVWLYYLLFVHRRFPFSFMFGLLPPRPAERRHKS